MNHQGIQMALPARVTARQKSTLRAGFTLVELLTVILIISVLAAACIGIYQQARNAAWKEKARDTARQIATAWNVRLMDDHAFPAAIIATQPFYTTAANMAILNDYAANRIYLEQNADQRIIDTPPTHGMKDRWGNFYKVQLDVTYKGTVPNPLGGPDINANVVVWSLGPTPASPSSSYCMAWQ